MFGGKYMTYDLVFETFQDLLNFLKTVSVAHQFASYTGYGQLV